MASAAEQAGWEAEDAAAAKYDAERTKYRNLVAELTAIETATGLYLTDENIDRENVDCPDGDAGFWRAMYSAACMAAGCRAEEHGADINALLGRVIY